MAKDVADIMRDTVNQVIREATQSLGDGSRGRGRHDGALSGMKGVAAGAGLATLAPIATKQAGKAVRRRLAGGGAKKVAQKPGQAVKEATGKLGESVGKGVGEKVKEGLPIGGGESGGEAPGVGKGRRMPVQQAMDVAVPNETAYNQWTQFADWPRFMHRVTRVSQEDPCTVSFATKIWGITKEFTAEIETQRPEERIKWRVNEGITHTGVVTFHELAPRLTRIELTVDVDPGSLLEKAARGMRHIKRAMRADLHRFKAFIEVQELETGAWRGVIEDGDLVEDHDPSYDEERDYSEPEAAEAAEEEGEEAEEAEEPEEEEETQQARTKRFERQARASSSGGAKRSKSRSSGNGRSTSGRSRSGGNSSGSGSRRRKATSR